MFGKFLSRVARGGPLFSVAVASCVAPSIIHDAAPLPHDGACSKLTNVTAAVAQRAYGLADQRDTIEVTSGDRHFTISSVDAAGVMDAVEAPSQYACSREQLQSDLAQQRLWNGPLGALAFWDDSDRRDLQAKLYRDEQQEWVDEGANRGWRAMPGAQGHEAPGVPEISDFLVADVKKIDANHPERVPQDLADAESALEAAVRGGSPQPVFILKGDGAGSVSSS